MHEWYILQRPQDLGTNTFRLLYIFVHKTTSTSLNISRARRHLWSVLYAPAMRHYLLLILACCTVVLSQSLNNTWIDRCKAIIETSTDSSIEFVNQAGRYESNLTIKTATGITFQSCLAHCDSLPIKFNWSDFSTSITNWLLPWLALAAQLPYETSGPFNNVMSVLLALGSPAFITYGLTITLFNRFRVAIQFKELVKNCRKHDEDPKIRERVEAASYLLQECQQAPMRVAKAYEWLGSLVRLDKNQRFWQQTTRDLDNTRRGVTASLVVQILFAVAAWLFTVIAAFDDLADRDTGLSISSSSIWLWMVPVVCMKFPCPVHFLR